MLTVLCTVLQSMVGPTSLTCNLPERYPYSFSHASPQQCFMFKTNYTFLSLHFQITAGYHVEITTEAISAESSSNKKPIINYLRGSLGAIAMN